MKQKIRIVFFDAKDYDIQSFEKALPAFRAERMSPDNCTFGRLQWKTRFLMADK